MTESITRRISTRIWFDDWFINFSNEEKILFFYILTGPQTLSTPGLVRWSTSQAVTDTGLTKQAVESCLKNLDDKGVLIYSKKECVVFCPYPIICESVNAKQVLGWVYSLNSFPDCLAFAGFFVFASKYLSDNTKSEKSESARATLLRKYEEQISGLESKKLINSDLELVGISSTFPMQKQQGQKKEEKKDSGQTELLPKVGEPEKKEIINAFKKIKAVENIKGSGTIDKKIKLVEEGIDHRIKNKTEPDWIKQVLIWLFENESLNEQTEKLCSMLVSSPKKFFEIKQTGDRLIWASDIKRRESPKEKTPVQELDNIKLSKMINVQLRNRLEGGEQGNYSDERKSDLIKAIKKYSFEPIDGAMRMILMNNSLKTQILSGEKKLFNELERLVNGG